MQQEVLFSYSQKHPTASSYFDVIQSSAQSHNFSQIDVNNALQSMSVVSYFLSYPDDIIPKEHF